MRQIKKGSTNVSVDVYIIDSTDGTPETGVLYDTAGMDLEYRRELEVVTNITEVSVVALTTAHTDGGFLEIGHGIYRLDVPDAAFATAANSVSIQGTVTGMIILPQTIQLVDFDPEDSVRLGLTALPNANADAAGGLPVSDIGGLDLDTQLANTDEVTAARMGALTDWINGGRLDLILDIIAADVVNIDGAAMRGTDSANTVVPDAAGTAPTASEIVNEWETQSQADPTGFHVNVLEVGGTAQTANDNGADINTLITQVGTAGDGLTNINLPNQTMDISGNITGSIGSVTGNVDGNVTGSVGSNIANGFAGVGLTHLAIASINTEARLSELDAGTGGKMANQVDIIETDTTSLNDTKIPQTLNLTGSGNIGIDWANVENQVHQ